MKTRTKTIEVEECYAELTRDQLMALRAAIRGGNADQDNVDLMEYVATLLNDRPIAGILRERAAFLRSALKQVEELIWPPLPRSPQETASD